MKKFIKISIIVLLVVAVIVGTCFFFFRKIDKKNSTTDSIAAMLQEKSKLKFNSDLYIINDIANSDGTDDRISLIIETNENLDEIVYVLATYYIDSNTKIENKDIANKINEVNALRNSLITMMKEYQIKKDSAYFNRHTGLNDLYEKSCSYLVHYATFANLLNDSLSNLDKSADIKFNMFNIYSNIVINSFNGTEVNVDLRKVVKNENNINLINDVFEIQNSFIVTSGNQFSISINQFNQYYNLCDKTTFANNLYENVNSVTTANQDTNEKIATYYFKLIYGI